MHDRSRKMGMRCVWKRLRYAAGITLALVLVACGGEPGQPTPVAALATLIPPAPAATDTAFRAATPMPLEATIPEPEIPPEMEEFVRQTRPEELAKRVELIVLGSTVGPQTTGRLPPGSPLAPPDPPGEPAHEPPLYTETQVQVERVLKGTSPGSTLRVRTLGATVDGQSAMMTHQPQLRVGQRVVLFLKQIEPEYYTPLGEDGVYEVVGEEASGPRHRFPLPDLLARIENSTR